MNNIPIFIIINPLTGKCFRVTEQLSTWPFPSTFLCWKLKRYSVIYSISLASWPGRAHICSGQTLANIFQFKSSPWSWTHDQWFHWRESYTLAVNFSSGSPPANDAFSSSYWSCTYLQNRVAPNCTRSLLTLQEGFIHPLSSG